MRERAPAGITSQLVRWNAVCFFSSSSSASPSSSSFFFFSLFIPVIIFIISSNSIRAHSGMWKKRKKEDRDREGEREHARKASYIRKKWEDYGALFIFVCLHYSFALTIADDTVEELVLVDLIIHSSSSSWKNAQRGRAEEKRRLCHCLSVFVSHSSAFVPVDSIRFIYWFFSFLFLRRRSFSRSHLSDYFLLSLWLTSFEKKEHRHVELIRNIHSAKSRERRKEKPKKNRNLFISEY